MKAIQTADHSINVISVVTNVEVCLNPITFSVSWFIKIDVSSIIISFPHLKVWPDTGSLTWQSPSSKEPFFMSRPKAAKLPRNQLPLLWVHLGLGKGKGEWKQVFSLIPPKSLHFISHFHTTRSILFSLSETLITAVCYTFTFTNMINNVCTLKK